MCIFINRQLTQTNLSTIDANSWLQMTNIQNYGSFASELQLRALLPGTGRADFKKKIIVSFIIFI